MKKPLYGSVKTAILAFALVLCASMALYFLMLSAGDAEKPMVTHKKADMLPLLTNISEVSDADKAEYPYNLQNGYTAGAENIPCDVAAVLAGWFCEEISGISLKNEVTQIYFDGTCWNGIVILSDETNAYEMVRYNMNAVTGKVMEMIFKRRNIQSEKEAEQEITNSSEEIAREKLLLCIKSIGYLENDIDMYFKTPYADIDIGFVSKAFNLGNMLIGAACQMKDGNTVKLVIDATDYMPIYFSQGA
ncbi:MAG: hypothetical protein RRY03_06070 [Oscillospiraceae bacterium]